ncbi:ER membrane protein complex subunit 4 [Hyalella azteca]|uniref:ER membrane protein complex subunit 4 n=1 Tax=Hyalella azteca TaxID=294128 RepID=A0A8B7NYA2_HYAAZ|nr:ER membrane protein complex subunit 4 [Hyalella azteca]
MTVRNSSLYSLSTGAPKRRWGVELGGGGRKDRISDALPSPPGYNPNMQICSETQRSPDSQKLVVKKAWDLALGPIKGVPMNLFLLYMSGNSISIFPIMMVGMMLMRPCKALFATNATFSTFEGTQAILQKATYLLGNLAQIGLALYKCQSLGLLPTHASDWLAFQEPASQVEFVHGGFGLW